MTSVRADSRFGVDMIRLDDKNWENIGNFVWLFLGGDNGLCCLKCGVSRLELTHHGLHAGWRGNQDLHIWPAGPPLWKPRVTFDSLKHVCLRFLIVRINRVATLHFELRIKYRLARKMLIQRRPKLLPGMLRFRWATQVFGWAMQSRVLARKGVGKCYLGWKTLRRVEKERADRNADV